MAASCQGFQQKQCIYFSTAHSCYMFLTCLIFFDFLILVMLGASINFEIPSYIIVFVIVVSLRSQYPLQCPALRHALKRTHVHLHIYICMRVYVIMLHSVALSSEWLCRSKFPSKETTLQVSKM
jgi:hypothetical protein